MKKSITIIGGGASALILAAKLDTSKYDVILYERNAAVGRKLLVAGDGGFNLTHSEELEQFISRYSPSYFLEKSIRSFTNIDLKNWLSSIGIGTFVGSSKRVFPVQGKKPIDVLNTILEVVKQNKVVIKTNHHWQGWSGSGDLIFKNTTEVINIKADITVFALGGGSWKVTGSDGSWLKNFEEKGIKIIPFQPSNCAVKINWKKELLDIAEGKSLKNISLKCGIKERKGEVVITKFGLEGGAIYALTGEIRKQLDKNKKAVVYLDLKPMNTAEDLKAKLVNRGNKSLSKQLEDALNLDKIQLGLLKTILTKEEFTSIDLLSSKIKNLPLIVVDLAPIDEAISTVGGIALNEVDENFQLKQLSNTYCIGEMLDWDAPTGGYLLQGCFSMGAYLAGRLNEI